MSLPGDIDAVVADLFDVAYRVAYRMIGVRADAEDIAQEICARAYLHWRRIGSYGQAWAARSASNLALDLLRRRSRDKLQVEAVEVSSGWERQDLVQALRRLPPRQRDVVVMRFIADLPEQVVADRLGCSVGAVKTHAHRALAALRASRHLQPMEGAG